MKDMKAIIIQKTNLQIETPIEYPEDYWEGLEPHEHYEPYEIHAEIETDLIAAQNDLLGEVEYDQEVILPRRTLQLLQNIRFDFPATQAANCIMMQDYSEFIDQSLIEYQKHSREDLLPKNDQRLREEFL